MVEQVFSKPIGKFLEDFEVPVYARKVPVAVGGTLVTASN
jgi:hypothetical protein